MALSFSVIILTACEKVGPLLLKAYIQVLLFHLFLCIRYASECPKNMYHNSNYLLRLPNC